MHYDYIWSQKQMSDRAEIDLRVVYVMVGALALFAPIYVALGSLNGSFYIFAMTWTFTHASVNYFRFLDYVMYMGSFLLTAWRLAFVYQIGKYYHGKSTRERVVLVGILTEIPVLVFMSMMEVLTPAGTMLWMPEIRIPTPFMLFAGVVFMEMTSFPVPKTYDDRPDSERWWHKKSKEESPVIDSVLMETRNRMSCPACGGTNIGREMYPGMFGVRAGFFYSCRECGRRWEG